MTILFETQRLLVRKSRPADVEPLFDIFSDAETVRHFGYGQPWSRAGVEQFLANYPENDERLISAPGVVLLKPHLEMIGFGGVGYYVSEGNTPDLLFILKREHWGQGLATELARAAVATAFQHPEVKTIFATVKPVNKASVRVLEKVGMVCQQYLPDKGRLVYRIEALSH